MRNIRTEKRLFCAFGLFLALAAWVMAGEAAPVIVILHTNDIHGRFAVSEQAIGHDRIATLFAETRRRVPATMLLDAGDAIQGTGLVKWNKGAAALEIMTATGYDGLVLGNHEFDYGWVNLLALLKTSDFPFFTQPVVSEGEPGFEAAAIYERGGRRIGVFGLTTPETKQSSAGGFDKTFGDSDDIVAYAEAMAASLRRAGAEVVVCLVHLGIDDQGFLTSYDLRDRVAGVDVIIDGHSHTPLAEIVQVPGRALIASTGEHARALGVVEFHCVDGRLLPAARSIMKQDTLDVPADPAVSEVIGRWRAEAEARNSKVVARSSAFLPGDRQIVRTRECGLGNLLADSLRLATGCDVAFINGGSIRAPLPEGEVTVEHIGAILPYDSTVLVAKVPGGAIREALELSVSRYPGEFGGFLQVSGLTFAFDPSRPAGKRVAGVEILGVPLDDDRLYSVALSDWLASGGDGYEMFVEPFRSPIEIEAMDLSDIFVKHLEKVEGAPLPGVEGRIVVIDS